MNEPAKYWFPAKTIGWGWGLPATWQGWVVLVGFVALTAASGFAFPPSVTPLAFAACVTVLCAALIAICMAKGEPPRWRSGR